MADDDMQREVVKDVGIFGLKTLLTLNSGSIVVLLAFWGDLLGSSTSPSIDIGSMRCSMISFLLGIMFALISILSTYVLAQMTLMRSARVMEMGGSIFILWMILPAVLSFLFFTIGVMVAIYSIG